MEEAGRTEAFEGPGNQGLRLCPAQPLALKQIGQVPPGSAFSSPPHLNRRGKSNSDGHIGPRVNGAASGGAQLFVQGASRGLQVTQHLPHINPGCSPEAKSAESECKCKTKIYSGPGRFGLGAVRVLPIVLGHFLLFSCTGPHLALASSV